MKLPFFFVLLLATSAFGQTSFETNAKLPNDAVSYDMPSTEALQTVAPVRCNGTLVSDQILSRYRQGNKIISLHAFTYKVEKGADPDFPYEELKFVWRQEQFVMPGGDAAPSWTPALPYKTIFVPKMWFYLQPVRNWSSKEPYFDILCALVDGSSDSK